MTVLIVDDNDRIRHLIRCAVAEVATAIWERCDGADALAAYAAYRPSVVLMDIRMARMDGLAATRQIMRAYPLARVVILTDYDGAEIRNAAKRAGACACALKLNLLDLAELICSIAGDPAKQGPPPL
jgi:DNA-binding NarL/FixJ family response regulator